MKKFVTIFPELENIHLIKDVGMIPYVMQKEYAYQSYIAAYYNEKLNYITTEVNDLKIIKINKIFKKSFFNVALFLIKNSKNIDVINIFHMGLASLLWIILYKALNNKGRVYLKLDTNINVCQKLMNRCWYSHIAIQAMKLCNIVSAETADVTNFLNVKFKLNIKHLANGVLSKKIKFNINKKEKLITTVARLGSEPKNSFLLLDVFCEATKYINSEWKLLLIGPCTEKFKTYAFEKIKRLHLENRIKLLGNIENRNILFDLLEKSYIFTMPSKWEGFSLAAVEAVSCANYLVASDLQCFKELTDNGSFGTLFKNNDYNDYLEKLIQVCIKIENAYSIDYDAFQKYIKENFTWESICKEINSQIIS